MKIRTRINLAAMRVVGVLGATLKWAWSDVYDFGGDALVSLIELIGNVFWLATAIVVGPFLRFREAWSLRKHITQETTWTKRRKPSTK